MLSDSEVIKLTNPIVKKDRFNAIIRAIIWCFENNDCRKFLLEAIRIGIASRLSQLPPYVDDLKKLITESQKKLQEYQQKIEKAKQMGLL